MNPTPEFQIRNCNTAQNLLDFLNITRKHPSIHWTLTWEDETHREYGQALLRLLLETTGYKHTQTTTHVKQRKHPLTKTTLTSQFTRVTITKNWIVQAEKIRQLQG